MQNIGQLVAATGGSNPVIGMKRSVEGEVNMAFLRHLQDTQSSIKQNILPHLLCRSSTAHTRLTELLQDRVNGRTTTMLVQAFFEVFVH